MLGGAMRESGDDSTEGLVVRHEGRPRHRLVIADDSADMRSLVRSTVGGDFTDVLEAADGRELFWTLLRSSFGKDHAGDDLVVITDLCMPGYDGLDVLDACEDLHPRGRVPMILMTAYPSAAVHARASALGVTVLAKPFSTSALRTALREVADG
jgi:CheY-like chemotaxis protein